MLKTLLSAVVALTLSTTALTNTSYIISKKSEDDNTIENFLKEDIEKNKIYLGKQSFIEYNDQRFTSENALKNYLLANSIIESEFTSSNPYKIIKDPSNMTLDSNQIYDLNMNNFQQVYRNAYGNVAQTSEDALYTYANLGLVKEKYSYDGTEWFDSPEEAKINQKNNLSIHKSLYYFYNDQYYNAFNSKDIAILLSQFDEGYYVKKEHDLSGKELKKPIIISGDKTLLSTNLKRELKDDFFNDYFYKVSEMKVSSRLEISPKGSNQFRIDLNNGNKQIEIKSGNSYTIEFAKPYTSETQMIDDFKDTSKWNTNSEHDGGSTRYYLQRKFEIKDPNNPAKTINATLKLVPKWPKWLGTSWPDINGYTYTDKTVGTLSTYLDETKSEEPVDIISGLNKAYDLGKVTPDNKDRMFSKWFDVYLNQKVTNFGTDNSKFNYENLKKGIYIKNSDGDVYKDLVYDINYDKGYSLSVITSFLEYQKKKEQILTTDPIFDENGSKRYKMIENFNSSEEQLNNFLFLDGNTFNAVVKYSFGTDEDQSSLDGKLLANTLEEAKELAFINMKPSLKKKCIVYDVMGKYQAEGSTPEETLKAIHNKIKLESKLVNKTEIETWDWDLPISYDQIISDGKYIIYKLKDEATNSYIYFPTEELVVKAALAAAKQNGKINNIYLDQYLYTYFDAINQKQFSTIFYNNDIDEAILDIMNQINNYNPNSNYKMLNTNVINPKQNLVYEYC